MQQAFQNILVPVDFSHNTEVAVTKAVDLIGKKQGALHLFHVKRSLFESSKPDYWHEEAKRLMLWKEMLEDAMPLLSVQCGLDVSNAVEQSIRKKAISIDADLIVIGKKSRHGWLRFSEAVNPSSLASQSNSAVLTVRPGSMHHSIKTVVVPVSEALPQIKMDALAVLCSRFRPVVHLVAFSGHAALSQTVTSTLMQLFNWVKNTLHCPVEYTLIMGRHSARQLMDYNQKTGADVLLAYPQMETKLGLWNRHIQDVLPAHSKVQVLTVHSSEQTTNHTHYA